MICQRIFIYNLTNFTDTILPLSVVNKEFNSICQEKVQEKVKKKERLAIRKLYKTKSNRTFIYGVKNVNECEWLYEVYD